MSAAVGEERQKALQEEIRGLAGVVGPAPIVDLLLERSFEMGATDVHFDPRADGLHVRLRVDGILHDILVLEPAISPQVISRLKLMSGMDITERRFAQDGHISSAVLRHQRDIRIASGPTIHGERLALRLMPDGATYTELHQLGLDEIQSTNVQRATNAPSGMVLSVGPVGSGKSTTIYSCLALLNDPGRSLVTIEDPVERRVEGVNQIQIDSRINFNFVDALRGVLRQDPDVIMVGEIRDPETAHIAVRAGLTGIRVLSTMHANDTGSTIDVFHEFDIPPMLLADSLRCTIAQRLLRKVCEKSRELYTPDESEARILGIPPEKAESTLLTRGVPSDVNFRTGYSGRTGIFEVLFVDQAIRQMILEGKSGSIIREEATRRGMQTLEQSAKNKVVEGITNIAEMHRVLTY